MVYISYQTLQIHNGLHQPSNTANTQRFTSAIKHCKYTTVYISHQTLQIHNGLHQPSNTANTQRFTSAIKHCKYTTVYISYQTLQIHNGLHQPSNTANTQRFTSAIKHCKYTTVTVLLLGILKKGPDPARTFKKRANQNISGPHTHLMQNILSISICALPFYKKLLFISIITNFLFLKTTFKIQKIYYNRFLPFLLSRDKKSRTISSSKC